MQQPLPEVYDDMIITANSRFYCKILQVTDSAIIYKYKGCRQGIPIRKIEYFRYGV